MENHIVISTFYHFQPIEDCQRTKEKLLSFCKKNDLKGTILLAHEGINSTISGTRNAIDHLYSFLKNELCLSISNFKESCSSFRPFMKMKVRLKKEIVAMGADNIDLKNMIGKYISPEDWAEFISREDVITIDTRNDYEVKIGTFKNSINPKTNSFRELPSWVDKNIDSLKNKKVAMFCTGGVRCEKSTALLKTKGINDVYHLEGGILNYLEKTNNKSKSWSGNCFVFDDRVAVDDNINQCSNFICSECNNELTTDDVRETAKIKQIICIDCYSLLTSRSK